MTIIDNEPMSVYHASKAYGSSDIRAFIRSPLLFHDTVRGIYPRETPAMLFGSASHMAILEPKRFALNAITEPDTYASDDGTKPWSNNAKVCKDWHANARKDGLVVLKQHQYDTLAEMISRQPREVASILSGGQCEVTVRVQHAGLDLQCRPDQINFDTRQFHDLKTISAIEKIDKSIWSLGYYIQLAHYRRVLKAETGHTFDGRLIFAETNPPYRWAIRSLDLDYVFMGDKALDKALSGILARTQTGCWDDPESIEQMVSPPTWAIDAEMDDEEEVA